MQLDVERGGLVRVGRDADLDALDLHADELRAALLLRPRLLLAELLEQRLERLLLAELLELLLKLRRHLLLPGLAHLALLAVRLLAVALLAERLLLDAGLLLPVGLLLAERLLADALLLGRGADAAHAGGCVRGHA
ncbi:hypothetical protein GCM10009801_56450 [Streptomyces albiaxialis]|uniref:Uncharacterized protein n=1 Tax=Streptomyces albiaxialis TaxID=329523 RepID=A0ABP5I1X1_9ACTN